MTAARIAAVLAEAREQLDTVLPAIERQEASLFFGVSLARCLLAWAADMIGRQA